MGVEPQYIFNFLKMNRLLAVLLLLLAWASPRVAAQEETYRFDIGARAGMAGYLGEASSGVFAHPGPMAGVAVRYLPDARWAVRGVLDVMSLSGNTANMANVLPGGRQYSFKSTVADLGARLEFNFFGYGIGETYKKLRRWSPYLSVGAGVSLAACDGQTNLGFNIPMGVGVKYKIKERWNLGAEFSMTKVFSDRVDGQLADLYEIKSSFLKNTDWYSRLSLSVSYEFGKRCVTCHYVE